MERFIWNLTFFFQQNSRIIHLVHKANDFALIYNSYSLRFIYELCAIFLITSPN